MDFFEYRKAQKIVWKYVLPMSIIGAIGSYIGAQLIINTDTQTIERLVGFGMIVGSLVLLSKPQLGVTSFAPSWMRLFLGYISYFFVVIWSTSITIGVGLFNALVQTLGFGMSMLEMKGTIKIPALVIGSVALMAYAEAGLINWTAGLVLFAGTIIGAVLGAKGSLRLGDVWLKRIFAISVIGFAIKLILGL